MDCRIETTGIQLLNGLPLLLLHNGQLFLEILINIGEGGELIGELGNFLVPLMHLPGLLLEEGLVVADLGQYLGDIIFEYLPPGALDGHHGFVLGHFAHIQDALHELLPLVGVHCHEQHEFGHVFRQSVADEVARKAVVNGHLAHCVRELHHQTHDRLEAEHVLRE
jgi:hypothetical protein